MKVSKSMKKNGFTMVELLVTIVILGVLSITAIVAVTRVINKSKTSQKDSQEKTMEMAARNYLQSNTEEMPKAIGESTKITANDLKESNYLKNDLKNSSGEDCMTKSYVKVYKMSKTDYTYKAYLYCGDDEVRDDSVEVNPSITIEFKGNKDDKGNIQDVTTAILAITIEGAKKDGKMVALDGYSFSLSVKTLDDPNYREVYNSGTLMANHRGKILIEKPISDYIDITSKTLVKAKVVARDVDGGYTEKEESSSSVAGKDTLLDETNPYCENISGEANSATDWKASRAIKVNCKDGDGSGCIRDSFTRTWPNEQQNEAEYAYIQVKDNAGNASVPDNFANQADPCDITDNVANSCRVRVNVDATPPTFTIGAYKRKATSGAGTKENTTNLMNAASVTNTSTNTYDVKATSYTDTGIKNNNYWFNNTYDQGVIYEVVIKDNIHLASWKWETNEPYQTSSYGSFRTGNVGENLSGTIDEIDMTKNNCGPREKTIYVYFKDEGLRKGRLTIKDKAGNSTVVRIEAKIDRTAPPVPTVTFSKYNAAGTSVTSTAYTPNQSKWSLQYVQAKGKNTGDKKANGGSKNLTADLSGFQKYKYKGKAANGSNIAEADGTTFNFNKDMFEGKNTIQYSACDKAGNCSDYTSAYNVWVDTKAPTVEVTGYVSNSNKKPNTKSKILSTITVSNSTANRKYTIESNKYSSLVGGWMNDANYEFGVSYQLNMTDNVNLATYNWASGATVESVSKQSISGKGPTSASIYFQKEGKRTGTLTVKDEAGNTITITINALLDRTPPNKPSLSNSSGGEYTNKDVYISMSSSDPKGSGMVGSSVSGIGKYQWRYRYANTAWKDYANSAKTSFKSTAYTAERNDIAYQRACDKAGNCSEAATTWIKIDKTPPSLVLDHTRSCARGTGNKVTSSCSDPAKTVSERIVKSDIKSRPGDKTIGWGNSGSLYFTCTDKAGNSTTKSYHLSYSSCACGENTCRYGCDTCGGGAYDCSYESCNRVSSSCNTMNESTCFNVYHGIWNDNKATSCQWCSYKSCKWISKTCRYPTYNCRCSNCKTGHNTCQGGYK